MVEKDGIGETQGGVGFAEVEFDSPTIAEVAGRYMVRLFQSQRTVALWEGRSLLNG